MRVVGGIAEFQPQRLGFGLGQVHRVLCQGIGIAFGGFAGVDFNEIFAVIAAIIAVGIADDGVFLGRRAKEIFFALEFTAIHLGTQIIIAFGQIPAHRCATLARLDHPPAFRRPILVTLVTD